MHFANCIALAAVLFTALIAVFVLKPVSCEYEYQVLNSFGLTWPGNSTQDYRL